MDEILEFPDRAAFRAWLTEHARTHAGVWLRLGKAGGPATVSAAEALEEALCFGWIDGQLRRENQASYLKYFAPRRAGSKWSDKNKALALRLEAQGRMTAQGRERIAEARENGQWDASDPMALPEEQAARLAALLAGREPAYTNLLAMPPSVRRTYARAYFDAKTDAGRAKRLAWIADRLDRNLRPMDRG
ncbi:MAG: hypothetical protein HFF17_06255 [Oscillospiraceae bacterium]|nr:hypothetical protein [Oscillospiraceae bacterium]